MTEIPQRLSLVTQTADILRRELQRGEWTDHLPGEIPLCDRLQVSRITVRAALEVLRRERLIEVTKGRRRRVTHRAKPSTPAPISHRVAFLASLPLHSFSAFGMFRISELRRHLQVVGYELEVCADARLARRNPDRHLQRIVDRVNASCWILYQATPQVQRWFEEQGLHAIIMGSRYEGISLPFIDLHNHAMCRHAVGVFLSNGHRRIALVIPKSDAVGALHCRQGFEDGFRMGRHGDATPTVVQHDRTVEGVGLALRRLFRSPATRPTALLVSHSSFTLTVLSHLAQMGLRIPQDVSLISLADEEYLSMLSPAFARFRFDHRAYAGKLFRMVLEVVRTGTLPARSVLVMPQFYKGESVARV